MKRVNSLQGPIRLAIYSVLILTNPFAIGDQKPNLPKTERRVSAISNRFFVVAIPAYGGSLETIMFMHSANGYKARVVSSSVYQPFKNIGQREFRNQRGTFFSIVIPRPSTPEALATCPAHELIYWNEFNDPSENPDLSAINLNAMCMTTDLRARADFAQWYRAARAFVMGARPADSN